LAAPIRLSSSAWTIFTNAWPGVRLRDTSVPTARSLTLLTKSLTTGRATSASSRAMRTSRNVSLMLSSVSLALPVTWRSVCDRRSVRFSNMVILSGPVKAEVCQAPEGKCTPVRHSKAAIITKCGGGAHLGRWSVPAPASSRARPLPQWEPVLYLWERACPRMPGHKPSVFLDQRNLCQTPSLSGLCNQDLWFPHPASSPT